MCVAMGQLGTYLHILPSELTLNSTYLRKDTAFISYWWAELIVYPIMSYIYFDIIDWVWHWQGKVWVVGVGVNIGRGMNNTG